MLYRGPDRESSEAWLRDGSILFGNFRGRKYFLLRPDEKAEPRLLYESEASVDEPAISSDGKWVAYGSLESGTWEVYVARFPQWDERRQISTAGGVQPHWRNDGREIVYLAPDGALMSVALKPAGSSLEAAPPVFVMADRKIRLRYGYTEQWTMSSDASKFFVIASRAQPEAPIPGLPFHLDAPTLRSGLNFTLTTTLSWMDLLGEITGGGAYDDLLPFTIEVSLFGITCRVLDLDHLIKAKRAAGRPKDFEIIAELELLRERQNH
ncbi:MAG: hypothetical protein SFV54_24320 [Bryobacteraceae bacterium]|nr:hypothetical protein [Bryobacteraceae bacterium]